MKLDLRNQCKSDPSFTKETSILQSLYRLELGEHEGTGPNKSSKTHYGNMLSSGNISGKNLLIPKTFDYAKLRALNNTKYETFNDFGLFNNLMSCMPMALELFQPLMLMLSYNTSATTLAIKSALTGIPISEVTEIGIEHIPTPFEPYTSDKTSQIH